MAEQADQLEHGIKAVPSKLLLEFAAHYHMGVHIAWLLIQNQ
jgi:hypothetical protein